ncbi:TIGR02391 family protein [Segatella oulorum]|uniref:TIGR02391 family protein n=1 Tax=Segatella oulorum TaxID=28136 RepID=UPI0028EAF901|nr:TIGR02391 family protein [Segatella oulorum]
MKDFNSIKNQILKELNSKKLSDVLPSIIDFAQRAGNIMLKQLCVNELYGYDADVELPEYRKIPVILYDKDGGEFRYYSKGNVIPLSEINKREYYPYRGTIENLENMVISSNIRRFIVLRNPFKVSINGTVFVAHSFEYFSHEIKPCILKAKKKINIAIDNIDNVETFQKDKSLITLHKDIIKTSYNLFIDGYYRQAVLDATIGLVSRVKQKSQCYELDNTPLMQNVFSPNKSILKISKSKDIQQGFMWLFSGVIMAFRNAHAHKLNGQITKDECLEQLYFINYLHRILDKSNPT